MSTHNRVVFPRHIYSLDALRGLAALGVVLWHWQHFFCGGAAPAGFIPAHQPFYSAFSLLYTGGWRAVDLFFCLSGFIFSWLYSDRIAQGEISFKSFALLRFSRLYPLHFATLLFCAAGEAFFRHEYGQSFVYQWNTVRQFILQLGLANSWLPSGRATFNGPIWSVSVEIFLYGIFFVVCAVDWRRWWQLLLLIVAGLLTCQCGNLNIGRGLLSFFIGAAAYSLCLHLVERGVSRPLRWALTLATAALWLGVKAVLRPDFAYACYHALPLYRAWTWHGKDVAGAVLVLSWKFAPELLLFPCTILTLALWEVHRPLPSARLAGLGQISYSSYLLHFPLQLVFVTATRSLGWSNSVYYSPWMLASFYAALLPLALLCFRHFELPCQSFLRAQLLPPIDTRLRTLARGEERQIAVRATS